MYMMVTGDKERLLAFEIGDWRSKDKERPCHVPEQPIISAHYSLDDLALGMREVGIPSAPADFQTALAAYKNQHGYQW